MKTGTAKSAGSVPARALSRESKYSDLIVKVRKMRRGQAIPVDPDTKFATTPAGKKKHVAFRNRIAAVVRRSTEDLEDRFTTYLTETGLGIKRQKSEPAKKKKAAKKKVAKKK